MVERSLCMREARGSIPRISNLLFLVCLHGVARWRFLIGSLKRAFEIETQLFMYFLTVGTNTETLAFFFFSSLFFDLFKRYAKSKR